MDQDLVVYDWASTIPNNLEMLPVLQDVIVGLIICILFVCLIWLQHHLTNAKAMLQCKLKSAKNRSNEIKAEIERMENRCENLRKRDLAAKKALDKQNSQYKSNCLVKEKELQTLRQTNQNLSNKMEKDEAEHVVMNEQKNMAYDQLLEEKLNLEKEISEYRKKAKETQNKHMTQLNTYKDRQNNGWFLETLKHESTKKENEILKRKLASVKSESEMYKSQIDDCKEEIMELSVTHDRMVDYYTRRAYEFYLDRVEAEEMEAIMMNVMDNIKRCKHYNTAVSNKEITHQTPRPSEPHQVEIVV